MKLSVIGAGYVGLTTAACFAQIGHEVLCSDNDVEKLRRLRTGSVPIFEPGLERVIADTRAAGRLLFGSNEEAIDWAEVIFICVGTPPLANGDADLSGVEGVVRAITKRANSYKLIVEKSTVPVQTASQLRRYLSILSTMKSSYDVASNPEFLREGSAVQDFLHPDRIVIGVDSSRAEMTLRQIYDPVTNQTFACPVHAHCPEGGEIPFLATDPKSAELIKHASNSFLAMKISFINMVSDLCEEVGADVTKVAQGMGLDARIGRSFLDAGLGFGGFCFPKDLQAFIRIAEKSGCDFSLLKEVEKINRGRLEHIIDKLQEELWVLRGQKVAIWGLAFKPNTDDIRFAPSIPLISLLLDRGVEVSAYDPQAAEKARTILPNINYCANPYDAAEDADAVLIVTEWEEFRNVEWEHLRRVMQRPLIVDGRNMFPSTEITRHGFQYVSVGRPAVPAVIDEVGAATERAVAMGQPSGATTASVHGS